jgi:hypothetical protein
MELMIQGKLVDNLENNLYKNRHRIKEQIQQLIEKFTFSDYEIPVLNERRSHRPSINNQRMTRREKRMSRMSRMSRRHQEDQQQPVEQKYIPSHTPVFSHKLGYSRRSYIPSQVPSNRSSRRMSYVPSQMRTPSDFLPSRQNTNLLF